MHGGEQIDEIKELSSSLSRMAMEAGVFATQLEVTLIGNDEVAEMIVDGDEEAFSEWLEEAKERYGDDFADLPSDVQNEMAEIAVKEARENLSDYGVSGEDDGN